MKFVLALIILLFVASCVTTKVKPEFESGGNVKFDETWSYCFHLYALSTDGNYLLEVNVPHKSPNKSSMKLIDVSGYSNTKYAISLYQGNDIDIEPSKEIEVSPEAGNINSNVKIRYPFWKSIVSVSIDGIEFPPPYDKVIINEARFSDFPISNFCAE